MKALHRPDLFGWSAFDEQRNVDFNGTVWVRNEGNIVIDPMPMSEHDQAHLSQLGGAAWVVVTNSDHLRAAQELAASPALELPVRPAKRTHGLQPATVGFRMEMSWYQASAR